MWFVIWGILQSLLIKKKPEQYNLNFERILFLDVFELYKSIQYPFMYILAGTIA